MAQTGYTPLLIYASGTASNVPSAANLTSSASGAELALNYADGKLFYKDSSGTVQVLAVKMPSSILPIANGGTNATATPTAGAVAYGTGTAYAFSAAGSVGQVLQSNGASAPTWVNLSTLGVSTFSAGTTGFTPSSATSGAVTLAGTLATTNGGTGLTSFTANGVVYASSSSALTTGSALTFDGTNLGVGSNAPGQKFVVNGASGVAMQLENSSDSNRGGRFVASGSAASGTFAVNTTSSGYALTFGIDSTEQMRLTSTGLGIGTSSPVNGLSVLKYGTQWTGHTTNTYPQPAGNIFFQMQSVANSDNWFGMTGNYGATSGSANLLLQANLNNVNQQAGHYIASQVISATAADLVFGKMVGAATTGGNSSKSEQMRLDSSGNLGLGVTPSAWSNYKAFQFGYTGALSNHVNLNYLRLESNSFNGSGGLTYIQNGHATAYTQNNAAGNHIWYTAPSGTAGNAITFTQAMTLDASGNWMVGGTTAIGRATVVGGSSQLAFHDGNGSNTNYGLLNYGGSSGELTLNANSSGGNTLIRFLTSNGGSNAERARITSSGNFVAGGSVALATNATDGFLYVPTCAGTPTGTPTAITGMAPIVVNTTNNKLYFYSGGAWRDAGP